jgi:hypothetical protein
MKKKEMHVRVEHRKGREKNIAVGIEEAASKAATKKKSPEETKK